MSKKAAWDEEDDDAEYEVLDTKHGVSEKGGVSDLYCRPKLMNEVKRLVFV